MAGEIAAAFVSLLPSARGFGPALERETSGPVREAGRKAGKLFAGGIVAATAIVGASVVEALGQSRDTGKMAAALGLSPAESQRMGKVAGSLYANAYGESFGEVSGAVESVVSSIAGMRSASSGDIEAVTAKALDFAGAFETDVARSTQVVGQLIKTGLAKDATEGFDLIVAASQRVPAAVREDLLDAADEYGGFARQIGLDGQQLFSLLVSGADQGAFGIDKTGDAIAEFAKLVTGDIARTQPVIEALGLNYGEMANALVAGGDTAAGATNAIVNGLLGIQDPAAQTRAALELFGTPLEDLGTNNIPAFLQALAGGTGTMDGFAGAADRMGATLNDNALTNLEAFKRTITQTFVNVVGGQVLPYVNTFAQMLVQNVGPALSWAADMALRGYAALQTFVSSEAGQRALATVMETVRSVAASLVDAWGFLVQTGQILAPVLAELWDKIQPGVIAAGAAAFVILNEAAKVAGDVFTVAAAAVAGLVGWLVENHEITLPLAAGIGAMVAAVVAYRVTLMALMAVKRGYMAIIAAYRAATLGAAVVTWALNGAMLANPVGFVVVALIGLVAALVVAWKHSETFRNIVLGAWDAIKTGTMAVFHGIKWVIETVVSAIGAVFRFYLNGFRLVWTTIFGAIKAGVELYIGAVKKYIETVVAAIGAVFRGMRWIVATVVGFFVGIKDGIVSQWNNLIGFLTGLPGRISGSLGGMWDSLRDGFRNALNTIIGWWNDFSLTIDIPDAIPGLPNEWTINTPNIPMLAKGGIVSRPTLAVVGEAGPEAVVPLPKLGELARHSAGTGPGEGGMSRSDLDYIADRMAAGVLARPNVVAIAPRGAGDIVRVGSEFAADTA